MSTFYLVRHAHADWTTAEDRPLSAQGKKDANCVADILQQYSIGAIYASPFRRARQTIEPFAARLGLPIHSEQDLQERQLGNAVSGGSSQQLRRHGGTFRLLIQAARQTRLPKNEGWRHYADYKPNIRQNASCLQFTEL